jgi:hypothetical protein
MSAQCCSALRSFKVRSGLTAWHGFIGGARKWQTLTAMADLLQRLADG